MINAGVMNLDKLDDSLDLQAVLNQFEVNALAPLRVVRAIEPLMNQPGKAILIGSRMATSPYANGANFGYRMSKAAVSVASTAPQTTRDTRMQ